MTVTCPVCRLANVETAVCRRCKADLALYRGAVATARRTAVERALARDYAAALAAWRAVGADAPVTKIGASSGRD